jgi:N-methylhydantoinase A/oxoprolinase/acetone carboxylase beta subunit
MSPVVGDGMVIGSIYASDPAPAGRVREGRREMLMAWRLGFDIGGTFTDFVLQDLDGDAVIVGKHLTTPRDPAEGVFQGLAQLLKAAGVELADVRHAVHGTTLGANLVIERKGAKTFLLTTRGFRDVLEIQRQLRYNINDLFVDKHAPLIPRNQIVEVAERVLADGTIREPLDVAALREALLACRHAGAESLAVAFLHSYANPAHEERVAAAVADIVPEIPVTLSSDVSPQYREYERTNTAVVNAYIMPRFRQYLTRLRDGLAERGSGSRLYLMQNNGGIATAEMIARFPVRSLDSGPAAGAILGAHVGRLTGHADLIAFDMGGTTAKACLIEDGRPARTDQLEVDMIGLRRGSGLPVNVPSVDLVEIGAGGGSIARIERGTLRVGPDSAGSDPGPACYGLGGKAPTVTDANLVLGYLDPGYFLGGARRLDRDAAVTAIGNHVATPLGIGVVEAAWGIHELVTLNMEGAIRVVSIGRGKDPRHLACVTFGGAGPVHGARLARSLGIRRLIVPFSAGVGSALGLLVADPRFDLARTLVVRLADAPWERVNALFDEMEREGAARLRETGLGGAWRTRRTAEVRYGGQGHDLAVTLPDGRLTAGALAAIERAHAEVYRAHYGYAEPPGTALEATNWKLEMASTSGPFDFGAPRTAGDGADPRKGRRPVYFPETAGFVECTVYDRYRLRSGQDVAGPAIVEERETTTVLLPGDRAALDEHGNLIVQLPR